MKVLNIDGHRPIKAWVDEVPTTEFEKHVGDMGDKKLNIEDEALQQLKNISRLPFIASNGVAVMPDVHAGKGSTIGTVIATDKAIIPAAVGVDIGCGMNAVRLSLKASDLPDSLTTIRHQIERDVPLGAGGAHKERRGEGLTFGTIELLTSGMRILDKQSGLGGLNTSKNCQSARHTR